MVQANLNRPLNSGVSGEPDFEVLTNHETEKSGHRLSDCHSLIGKSGGCRIALSGPRPVNTMSQSARREKQNITLCQP